MDNAQHKLQYNVSPLENHNIWVYLSSRRQPYMQKESQDINIWKNKWSIQNPCYVTLLLYLDDYAVWPVPIQN
jgi:hypothetical protein